MITLQNQKRTREKKALPSNCDPKGSAYCNGRIPVSGAGPSLNTKIRFRTMQDGL